MVADNFAESVRRLSLCHSLASPIKKSVVALSVLVFGSQSAMAQGVPATTSSTLSPIRLEAATTQIAQTPPPTLIPTDVTPFGLQEERGGLLSPDLRFHLLQRLPERLWYNVNTEVSQRLETNVFFTKHHNRPDYVFRVLPNITLGYNVLKRTSIYCNYFVIKDVFANHTSLTFPTTQSLSLGFRQEIPLGRKAAAQLDFQARELWQTAHLNQADLIPSLNLTYFVNPKTVLFGNVLLQMRSRNYFQGATRELDPFYTVGALYRWGQWSFVATDTFVTNFRSPPFHNSVPRQGNVSMIADFEISRPITRKTPWLVGFIRAEPVWNWRSKNAPGLSGFDFRLFGGVRIAFAKQSYTAAIEQLREQLLESEKPAAGKPLSQRNPKQAPASATPSEPTLRGPIENPPADEGKPDEVTSTGEEMRMFISQPLLPANEQTLRSISTNPMVPSTLLLR